MAEESKQAETGKMAEVKQRLAAIVENNPRLRTAVASARELPTRALHLLGIPANEAEKQAAEMQKQTNELALEIQRGVLGLKDPSVTVRSLAEGGFTARVDSVKLGEPTQEFSLQQRTAVSFEERVNGVATLETGNHNQLGRLVELHDRGNPTHIKLSKTIGVKGDLIPTAETHIEMTNSGTKKKPQWKITRAEEGITTEEQGTVMVAEGSRADVLGRSLHAEKQMLPVFKPIRHAQTPVEARQMVQQVLAK